MSTSDQNKTTTPIFVSQFDIDPECLLVQIRWRNQNADDDEEGEDEEDDEYVNNQRQAVLTLTEEGLVDKVMVKMGGKRIRKMEERISARRRIGGGYIEEGSMEDLKNLVENLVWVV